MLELLFNTKEENFVKEKVEIEMAIFTGIFLTLKNGFGGYEFFATSGRKSSSDVLDLYLESLEPKEKAKLTPVVRSTMVMYADVKNKVMFVPVPGGKINIPWTLPLGSRTPTQMIAAQLPDGWQAVLYKGGD